MSVDLPTLSVEVAFAAGANPAAWSLGNTPLPAQLGEETVDTYTDVTGDVRELRIERGKSREMEQYQPGRAALVLDNRAQDYDPLNLSGAYVSGGVTQIKPGRRVRVKATHPTTGVEYDLYRGVVRDWGIDYGKHDSLVRPVATDALADLARAEVDLTTTAGLTGAQVAEILADAGIAAYQADDGASTMQSTATAGSAEAALRTLMNGEQGDLYVEREGVLTFKDRHSLLQEDRSARPQAFFGAGPFTNGVARHYLKSLAPSLLLGMGGPGSDEPDESGNGNDAAVTYAAGQRQESALDYGGDGATTFEQGTTNILWNPQLENNANGWGTTGGTAVGARVAATGLYGATFAYQGTVAASLDGVTFTADGAGGSDLGTTWTLSFTIEAADAAAVGTTITYWVNPRGGGTYETPIAGSVVLGALGTKTRVTATGTWAYASHTGFQVFWRRQSGAVPLGYPFNFTVTEVQYEQKGAATSYCHGGMGTGYSWAGTAHASASTRVSTKVQVPDDAAIQDIFDGGGALIALVHATGGEQDIGIIASRNRWVCSWNTGLVRFTCAFSGGTGGWQLSSPLSEDVTYALEVLFNADSASNDPTIRVANLSTGVVTTYTVGSGITEYAAPSGTRTSDVGDVFVLGNASSFGYAFAGRIDEVALWKGSQPTLAQFTEYATRAKAGYLGEPLVFQDIDCRYEGDLVRNDVKAQRTGGSEMTASDADSIRDFGRRSLSYTGLTLAADSDVQGLADFLLAKRKDPAVRIRSISIAPQRSAELMTEALSRRLRDRVTVQFIPAGGVAIQQEVFIVGIEHEFRPGGMRTTFRFEPTDQAVGWRLGYGRLGTTTGPRATALTY